MYFGEGAQIKLFELYHGSSPIGIHEREKTERDVNDFLKEHDGNVIQITLQDNIIMIVYRDGKN